nr:hypothetical protein [Tanacetum cinerariifolium]
MGTFRETLSEGTECALHLGPQRPRVYSDLTPEEKERTMETTIEQQVAMDEAFVPSAQRNILHICLRVQGQTFAELPFEEEILDFIWFLRHSATIRTLTDVNINKLYQRWRSFTAVINKCLTGKTSGYDCLRLSQAQILWGLYHKRNINYAFLIWEDFVYQVEHKNHKKSNEMYYPRFTKVIIHHFMSKDLSIPRRNKVNWHYVSDDFMFSTIKLVSRHQSTQQFDAMLPIELTNEEIKNSKAYKEYYAIATGEAAPKPKASARRTKCGFDTFITPPTATATLRPTAAAPLRLTATAKGKQTAKAPKAKSVSALSEVAMTEAAQLKLVLKRSRQQMHISQPGGSGTDKGTGSKPGVPDVPTDESEEELSWNSSDDEGADEQEKVGDDDEGDKGGLKNDDQDDAEGSGDDDEEGGSDEEDDNEETRDGESFDPILQTPKSSEDEGNSEDDQGLNISEEERLNEEEEADELYRDVDINQGRGMESIFETASTSVASLPVTAPTMTPSTILTTSQSPTLPTPIPSDVLQNLPNFASVFRFDDRLRSLEENFSEFRQTNQFAEAVKEQVKAQVSNILPMIEQAVNKQLEAEVLTRSSHSSRTSYAVAAGLSEMELKKILIEKIKGNKSIQRSDEQRNLYKDLVDAYESNKIILNTYREYITLKRRRDDDEDKDEEPFAGPDRGSKIRKEEEPVQTTSQMEEPSHLEFETGADDQPIIQSSQHPEWFSQPKKPPSLDRDWNKTLPIRVDTLTPELLVGPTYELMKGSCKSLIELEYHLEEVYKDTTDQLDWSIPKGRKRQQFYGFVFNREYARDVYSKRRIITVMELKIVEWHSYKHLDWITVRQDDNKLYKFKEGDFKRLRLQDIKDMLLLLRRMEDLQLGVESYQKKLNLTKSNTYRADLKRKEAYTAYTNPRGFIYQDKDKKNRLMRIDELHKFSDGTLTDVRTALDDRLKGIQMQYLPQIIWRRSDKDRASAMIQAIEKRLKTKRVIRSLERFVGGRLYEGDFRMLQRTI